MGTPTSAEVLRELKDLLAPTSRNGLNTERVSCEDSQPQPQPIVFAPTPPAPPAPAESPVVFASVRTDRQQPAEIAGMLFCDQDSTGMLF